MLGREGCQLGHLWKAVASVGELAERAIDGLQIEQALLRGGIGVQGWLPSSGRGAVCMVHGSVGVVDTRVSTVVPASERTSSSRPAASASQGHSLAQ